MPSLIRWRFPVSGITCMLPILGQILKSWLLNRNRFPHSTFNWVGIDGTQLLCHMTPGMSRKTDRSYQLSILSVDTYGAQATVQEVNKGITNHKVSLQITSILPLTSLREEFGVIGYRAACVWQWRWRRWPIAKDVGKRKQCSLHQNHPLNGRISFSCDALGLWRTRILKWSLSTWVNLSMNSSTT